MDHALAGWLFVTATGLLLLGFPVAFTLLGTSLLFGVLGFGWDFFNLLPLRIWGVMSTFTLTAVQLFIFMGMAMERSGIATRLIESMGLLFGRVRGGMAVSVVLVGALRAPWGRSFRRPSCSFCSATSSACPWATCSSARWCRAS
jgi:TRAP-type mannitol/chloroaromatic compound transport system permease large subunit